MTVIVWAFIDRNLANMGKYSHPYKYKKVVLTGIFTNLKESR